MADKLTPQQEQAVLNRGGKLLVSAAAGSGKTKVLVDRLMTYLMDPHDPANLDEFLIITYTNAAAAELRGKIAGKLTQKIAEEPENRHLQKQMQRLFLTKISTVHGFCGDLLREYAYRLELPADFRIADENECREIREAVLEELLERSYRKLGEDEDFRAFVDTQGIGRNDRMVPQLIEKVYDSARCHLDPQGWLDSCLEDGEENPGQDVGQTVWGRYLIGELQDYLDCQIRVLTRCASELEAEEGLEKPAANLRDTLYQIQALRDATSWDEVVQKRNIDYGRLTFPKKNPNPELTERVKAARDACKEGLKRKLSGFSDDSRQILQDLAQTRASTRGLIALVRQFEQDYQAAKKSRRVLDFGDLEHRTLDLLLGKSRKNPSVAAEEVGRRYREILVDEYQDSNAVQDAIFSVLTRGKQNCFLVGDVKQSIYQFRLADPGIFLEKYREYLPAEQAVPGQGRKVLLSHNFRSGPEVIDAVNAVFACCMRPRVGGLEYGEAEALREGAPHKPLPDAGTELYALEVQTDTYEEEAAFVAERIGTMLAQGTPVRDGTSFRPVQPEDIVILLRSPGTAGGYFQRALEARGIRCATGAGTNLLQTEEIGTFRAFLQVILNPRQDIPLIATLASPIFGFTADDLAAFRGGKTKCSVYDALLESDSRKAGAFLDTLMQLRQEARRSSLTVLMERCIQLTRLDSVYAAMPGGEAKNANIQAFFQLAADYEKGSLRDLAQFLDHLEALDQRGLILAGASGSGCVSIMSIHKSKGLEFPVVFLCNLARRFNLESARAQILCDQELGIGLSVADPENRIRYPSVAKRAISSRIIAQSVSEEMRVLYVAMTRAKDRLIMTYAPKNLEKDIREVALRQDFDGGELLCRDAVCMGDWVLLTAMGRTEAGQLHQLGGRPAQTKTGKYPWKIQVVQAPQTQKAQHIPERDDRQMPPQAEAVLEKALRFRYPQEAATMAPSKQTATGRKGRAKDAEAAEDTDDSRYSSRIWRKPSFLEVSAEGKAYGSAIHAAMQYLRYESCGTTEAVVQEIRRLVEQGFLTQEQGELVNCAQIGAFFQTEIGKKLRSGVPHLREFKFSILNDGSNYGPGLEGEQVLLQGVVDCALLEEDGITVLDFKTDKVREETLEEARERYRLQIQTYGEALQRIYEMPIKGMYLYFFRLNRFVKV